MVRPIAGAQVVSQSGCTSDVLEELRVFAQPQELPHVETGALRLIFVRFLPSYTVSCSAPPFPQPTVLSSS